MLTRTKMQSITAEGDRPERIAGPGFIDRQALTYLSNWMAHRGHVRITARKSLCEEWLVCSPLLRC